MGAPESLTEMPATPASVSSCWVVIVPRIAADAGPVFFEVGSCPFAGLPARQQKSKAAKGRSVENVLPFLRVGTPIMFHLSKKQNLPSKYWGRRLRCRRL